MFFDSVLCLLFCVCDNKNHSNRIVNLEMGIISSIEDEEEERNEDLEAGWRPEDLAYLQFPFSSLANLAPQLHSTACVKSPVNLRRSSLQLIATEERNKYNIQFVVDTTTGCTVKIYYKANEIFGEELQMFVYKSSYNDTGIHSISLPKGLNQTFTTPKELQLDITLFKDDELVQPEHSPNYYPIVIILEPIKSNITNVSPNEKKQITAQITMAALNKTVEGNSYEIKTIKQKIVFGGVPYVVYEIFGIENIKYGIDAHPEECVICMSEPRNTIIIPCRHLCLCDQCADALRFQTNKCPICRGPVRSLLKIEVHGTENAQKDENSSSLTMSTSTTSSEENSSSIQKKPDSKREKKRNRIKKTARKQTTPPEETVPLTANLSTEDAALTTKEQNVVGSNGLNPENSLSSSNRNEKNAETPLKSPKENSILISSGASTPMSEPLPKIEEKKEGNIKAMILNDSVETPIFSEEHSLQPSFPSPQRQTNPTSVQNKRKEPKMAATAI